MPNVTAPTPPAAPTPAPPHHAPLLTLDLRYEEDVVLARQRARQLGELLGFDAQEQTRLATAVSEVARNAFRYAGGGRVAFALDTPGGAGGGAGGRQQLVVRVEDDGPGIADLDAVLGGRYRSATGMGLGLLGAKRLADAFDVRTAPGAGTVVTMARALPRRAPPVTAAGVARLADALARQAPRGAYDEVQAQNHELLRTLEELRARQAEVERLNQELAETNRGVLALYAELDDRAQGLRRASELKSSFLSSVSHELRTPLTSIVNLARLLADTAAAPGRELGEEQRTAVRFIRQSAQALTELVNDLLDLAKIEAGKVEVRAAAFTAADLVAALRGMFRPLATHPAVALVLEEPPALALVGDEGKVSQVLRNLVANALKYTEAGEVRLTVSAGPDDTVAFAVRDTGIGIAPADQARVFDEFAQVDHPLQRRTKGTGLGLPLSRRLAELLGGTLTLASVPGEGSTFTLRVPRAYAGPPAERPADAHPEAPGAAR